MPVSYYEEPRLTALYDAINPFAEIDPFYLSLAGAAPLRILDVGCGSGRLALALAARGHSVTGADPAPTMLDVARAKPGSDAVEWLPGTAPAVDAALAPERVFDLAVMTGNVFQFLGDDAGVAATLNAIRRRLAPAGRFAFDSRNPAARAWETWTQANTTRTVTAPDGSAVTLYFKTRGIEGEYVTYETHFRFAAGAEGQDGAGGHKDAGDNKDAGEHVVTTQTVRFMAPDAIAAALSRAGFGDVTWYGNWDKTPLTDESPKIIAVASAG